MIKAPVYVWLEHRLEYVHPTGAQNKILISNTAVVYDIPKLRIFVVIITVIFDIHA